MSHFDGKIFLSPDVETNHHYFTKQVRNEINIVGHINKKENIQISNSKTCLEGCKKVLLIYDGMVWWVSVESRDFVFACV